MKVKNNEFKEYGNEHGIIYSSLIMLIGIEHDRKNPLSSNEIFYAIHEAERRELIRKVNENRYIINK